jgi:hypothetical protein
MQPYYCSLIIHSSTSGIKTYPNLKIAIRNDQTNSAIRFCFLQLGDYFCFSHKWAMFKIKTVENQFLVFCGPGAKFNIDFFIFGVVHTHYRGLHRFHCLDDGSPTIINAVFFQCFPDIVHHLVGQYPQPDMRFYVFVFLMVDRTYF